MVAALCGEFGVPHAILSVTVDPGNIQSNARAARYDALDAWAAAHDVSAIATAHHADDQAETFLMRLNRGSGLAGLSGIRRDTVSPSGKTRVLRPLLDWRKAELERCVADAGIEAAQDPSNADDRFDRARMRKHLAEADWLDVEAIARSASHLASAQDAFDALAKQQMETNVTRTGSRYVYRPTGPADVQMLVMERLIARFDGAARRSAVAELRGKLLAGQRGNLAGVLVTNVGGAWRFEAEPQRKSG